MKKLCSTWPFPLTFLLATFALLPVPAVVKGSTVWNGPVITFTETAGANGTQAADQDRMTSDVWLTRNVIQGLYNAATEPGYTHFSSPAGTEWAYGALANYS